MECRYLFNKVKYSEELIAYTENKLLKQLEKYTNKNIEAVISFKSQGIMSVTHCHYYGGNGFNIIVQGKSRNLFESVDFMLHKLQVQLKRRKEKIKDHHSKDKKLSQRLGSYATDLDDWENEPMDAEDVIKYEQARKKRAV